MVLPETCLSLCSGVAGLDLGLRGAFPGLRVVAYCERDPFAATVLLARMADEALESAPIWVGDMRELDAAQFVGVDAVSAGYPCQPFSCAGKRKGDKDERHLWPEVLRIVRECRPRFVFLENVSAHLRLGFDRVLCDLAELGFNAEWAVVSAAEAGAPHLRKRLFVLAYAADEPTGTKQGQQQDRPEPGEPSSGGPDTLANPQGVLGQAEQREQQDGTGEPLGHSGCARTGTNTARGGSRSPTGKPGPALANPDERGCEVERVAQPRRQQGEPGCEPDGCGQVRGQPDAPLGDTCSDGRVRRSPCAEREAGAVAGTFPPGPSGDWSCYPAHAQPAVRRAPHGSTQSPDGVDLAFRVDRLRCCGNAVVPAQAELAFRELWERLT